MRSNATKTYYTPQTRYHSEILYPYGRTNNSLYAESECLMAKFKDVIEQFFSSSLDSRGYVSIPEYFNDILYSVTNIDKEFRKVDYTISSKEELLFTHTSANPKLYSLENMVCLSLAVKSVLELIKTFKEDLMFSEYRTSVEGKQSLFKTKIAVNKLETKLYKLLRSVENFKMQLPDECTTYHNHRFKDSFGREECSFNSPCPDITSNSTSKYSKKCHSKLVNENFHKKLRPNLSNESITNFGITSRKISEPQHYTFSTSQENKTRCKITNSFKQCKRLGRETTNGDPPKALEFKSKSLTQLHIKNHFNGLHTTHHVARRDQCLRKIISNSDRSDKDSMRGFECNKKKVKRNIRKRTRAGHDNVRGYRSQSGIYRLRNQKLIGKHCTIIPIIKYISDYDFLRAKYNSESSLLCGSEESMQQSSPNTRKINKSMSTFLFGYQSEPNYVRKRQTSVYLPQFNEKYQVNQNEPRLPCGATFSGFSINKQYPSHHKRTRKKKNYVRRTPSSFSINPSKRKHTKIIHRPKGRRKRKTARKILASRSTSDIICRPECERDFLDDDCCCAWSCHPTGCCYTCVPSNCCKYQPIPYPMCSNTCCAVITPEYSEQCFIEFKPHRKKKIVKRYIRPKQKIHYEQELKSESYIHHNEGQYISESVESLSQARSYKTIYFKPPKPSKAKSKRFNFYRESSERVVEYDSFTSNKTSPVATLSEGTGTENVSTVETKTSTSEIIRAVKAIATNTPKVSTRDIGITPMPQRIPTPPRIIKTETRETNTEKLKGHSVGTDTEPITERPYVWKATKSTNTAPEIKKNFRSTGTNPMPENKKHLMNVGTNPPEKILKSKSINKDPIREKSKPKFSSKGTQVLPLSTKNKETTYDKVKTREDGTDPVKKKMVDEEQQFEPEPVISLAKLTNPDIRHKYVISSQRLGHKQVLSKKAKEHLKFQPVAKQPVNFIQNLGPVDNVQTIGKQPVGNLQTTTKQPVDYRQSTAVDKKPEYYCVYEPQHPKEQAQIINIKNPEYTSTFDPQRPKQQAQTINNKTPEYNRIYDPQRLQEQAQEISNKNPEYNTIYEPKRPNDYAQVISNKQPEYNCVCEQHPGGRAQILNIEKPGYHSTRIRQKIPSQSLSDMSMHLTLEKVHEEIFRKLCRICKCRTKCNCRCCYKRCSDAGKIIICEKKKSNIIRITNRSDCNLNLQDGEEIVSDVDVDVSFNVASSCSAIRFASNKVQERATRDYDSGFYDEINKQNYFAKHNFDTVDCPSTYCNSMYVDSNFCSD